MLQVRITIGGQEYFVPPEHDATTIMDLITAQVRVGGGFVEVARTPDRVVNVLVSPGMSLSVEVSQVDDPMPGSDGEVSLQPAQSWLDPFDLG